MSDQVRLPKIREDAHLTDRDDLLVVTLERMRERYDLDVRVRTEVVAIDRAARTVRARDLATGKEYDEPYDKLILSPGAAPVRPDVPGIGLPGISRKGPGS